MYGLMVELNDFERDNWGDQVDNALAEVGYERVAEGIYICPNPKHTELLVVHDAIMALRNLSWFNGWSEKVIAFRIAEWGDITNAFKTPVVAEAEDFMDEYAAVLEDGQRK